MKTFTSFLVAAFVLMATVSMAQDRKTVFETASLTASADGRTAVMLNWKQGEESTAYYLVERSTDGKEFKQIAMVFTWEDAQNNAYKFRDRGFTTSGVSLYYRIGVVNEQKEVNYLPVKKVALSATSITRAFTVDAAALAAN
jgi:hypothetical protein